jgi:hypothetical protein
MTTTSPATPRPRRRRPWKAVALVAALALCVGHFWFWYFPRPRARSLDPRSPAGALLVSAPGSRLWLPYPHQSPVARQALALGERLAGTPPLPRFGPLRLPPSRELAVAASPRSTAVVVSVYPIWAAIGRLAGLLSGNPWLRTGRFDHRGEKVEVAWRGATWQVVIGAEGTGAANPTAGVAAADPPDEAPLLAAVAFDRSLVPARDELGGLDFGAIWGLRELRSGEARWVAWGVASREAGLTGDPARWKDLLRPCAEGPARAATCWFERRAAAGGDARPVRGLVLLQPPGPGEPGVLRLPSAAAVVRLEGVAPAPRRPPLPAEALARRLDATLLTERHAGWEVTALDQRALEAAHRLIERWTAARSGGVTGQVAAGDAELLVWLAPRSLAAIADEVAAALATLPLADADHGERWRLAAELLAQLESVDGVEVLARRDGILLHWTTRAE